MSGRQKSTRRILLSLKPCFAEQIYSGKKTYEFRRVRCHFRTGDIVYIYETGTGGAITGEFRVGEVFSGKPSEVASKEMNPVARQDVLRYLSGCKSASAIGITKVKRWARPTILERAYPTLRPPQSYQFL